MQCTVYKQCMQCTVCMQSTMHMESMQCTVCTQCSVLRARDSVETVHCEPAVFRAQAAEWFPDVPVCK